MNQPFAQNAINTLQALREIVGPASVAYFIGPNVILTLSGARGYCDGVFYSSTKATREAWQRDITLATEVLRTLVDVYSFSVGEEKNPREKRYVAYDLVLREGLECSLVSTNLLATSPGQLFQQAAGGILLIKDNLKPSLSAKQFSEDDRRYISTGIILGYPDKAIIESIGQWGRNGDPFAPRLVQADVRGADYYRCPQPVYSYPRTLVTDLEITQHEAMWSDVLRGFYESDFHQELRRQPEF